MALNNVNALLSDINDYLHITWNDEKTNKNTTGMINRGMSRLNNIAGVPELDFMKEELPRQLLFDYVRYANAQALEMFEKNFQSELLTLHYDYQEKTVILDENNYT